MVGRSVILRRNEGAPKPYVYYNMSIALGLHHKLRPFVKSDRNAPLRWFVSQMSNISTTVASVADVNVTSVALEPCPIDRAHLARYTLGDPALEQEILGLFIGQALRMRDALVAANEAGGWREAAHAIKGSARAVGAWRVADCAERAERLEPNRNAAERREILAALNGALDEACAYIDPLLARLAAE
jgi:HPt (histidine-containing phosphotransfer) domain-containing protein